MIRRAWRRARKEVLTSYEFGTPLGRRVYDLWHTCLTKWLNAVVPPATVAEWAGNSVPVLLATYARCVDGQLHDLKQRIEQAGELPDPAVAGSENSTAYSPQPPVETRDEPEPAGHASCHPGGVTSPAAFPRNRP
ncbi:hypothetical protein ABTY59_05140 [Streptomyces sp. NPDC096079]|uniref:hypothetical protein n=1 Tax=unclassified Streptomyces TaxID=2593676 RepID=UPI00331C3E8C